MAEKNQVTESKKEKEIQNPANKMCKENMPGNNTEEPRHENQVTTDVKEEKISKP